MSCNTVLFTILLFFGIILFAESFDQLDQRNSAYRIPNSPYPVSSIPDTLFVVDIINFSESEILTSETLQGLIAREKPEIFRVEAEGSSIWLIDLNDNHGIIVDSTYIADINGLIQYFADRIDGTIMCNLDDNSTNAAISLCGIFNSVAITTENAWVFDNLEIPQLQDVRYSNESDIFTNYTELFSQKIIIYQKEDKFTHLSDYSVFSQAFHFFDDINSSLTDNALERMIDNSALLGWGDSEFQTITVSSNHSVFVHPADWAVNLSTLSNFDIELQQQTHSGNVETESNVHTVCFLFTDGDNIQWMLNDFASNERWYANPNRGLINIGWTTAPALCELGPTVLNYLYQNAANTSSGKDYFIAGPSGLGYIFPEEYPEIESHTSLLNEYMAHSDLNIVNIIGNNAGEDYLSPYLSQDNIDAVFYYDFANYAALNGEMSWMNGKPVIAARFRLWDGIQNSAELAGLLNEMPKNPNSENGYSLIPVHNWSMTVDSVLVCANLLDSDVRIVTPDEFVKLINQNLYPQFQPGDVNMDNALNVLDVVQVVGYILGALEFDNEQFTLGDLNSDGSINVQDVVILVQLILEG